MTSASGPRGSGQRRWRVRLWWAASIAVAVAAGLAAATHRQELVGASHLLARLSWPELAVAAALEAASFLSLAALQRWLLRAEGTRLGLGTVTGLVVAANAMAAALPGGSVFSVAWTVRQLRRRAAELTVAAAMLVAAGALSVVTLALLLVLGALVADPAGPAAAVRTTVLALAGGFIAAGLLVSALACSSALRGRIRHVRQRAVRRWPVTRRLADSVADVVRQARTVQPEARAWVRPFAFALLNWTADAAALVAVLWALGIGVPWRGILLVYGLTELSISLRLTPGSLGIADTSLTTLLVLYGLNAEQAIAAALLYRILSFWLLQPIGWASWLYLTLHSPGPRPPTEHRTGRPDAVPIPPGCGLSGGRRR